METNLTLVKIFYRVGVFAFPLAAMMCLTVGLVSIREADTLVGSIEGILMIYIGLTNALFALQSLHVVRRDNS